MAGELRMGQAAQQPLAPGSALLIHTGGMLPPGADAVIMLERTQQLGSEEIELLAPVAPGENLLQPGEDIARDSLLLAAGQTLRPQEIGGLLAAGVTQVRLRMRARVAILSSGDELVPPEAAPAPGQIRDINAHTLAALVSEAGATPPALRHRARRIRRLSGAGAARPGRSGPAAADRRQLGLGARPHARGHRSPGRARRAAAWSRCTSRQADAAGSL